jgi:hypothetical protein
MAWILQRLQLRKIDGLTPKLSSRGCQRNPLALANQYRSRGRLQRLVRRDLHTGAINEESYLYRRPATDSLHDYRTALGLQPKLLNDSAVSSFPICGVVQMLTSANETSQLQLLGAPPNAQAQQPRLPDATYAPGKPIPQPRSAAALC